VSVGIERDAAVADLERLITTESAAADTALSMLGPSTSRFDEQDAPAITLAARRIKIGTRAAKFENAALRAIWPRTWRIVI
jgi:hypothetical protein